jgi:GNAT superfamily N-acetyltransferase
MPEIAIRSARPEDVPLILAFIRELAEYEHLSHEVVATEDRLRATLFGDRPFAEVILAESGGDPAGFSLFFHNYSTFLARPGIYVEDIFVRPPFRNQGIGRKILTHICELAAERECGRVEWSVLDWNAPAITFYENLGAVRMADWRIFRLTGAALEKMAAQNGTLDANPTNPKGRS